MKKIYYISIAILFVIFLIAIFLPFYKPLYFFTKHISLFLLVSLIFFGILKRFYNQLETKLDSKKYILKSLTVITFGLLIFVFSEVQMAYINTFETPAISGCTYYDSHGNLIYDTILPMNCGEIEVIINTPYRLEITVIERMSNEYRVGESDLTEMYPIWGDSFSGVKKTDITVTYDSKGRIITASLLSSTNYEIIDNESVYSYNPYIYYNSFKRIVINEYYEDSFKSTQKVYVLEDIVGNWSQLDEVTHYDFSEDEGVIEILRSDISGSVGNTDFFTVTKETITQGVSNTEEIAVGHIEDSTGEYSKEISYKVLVDQIQYPAGSVHKHYLGENSFKETLEIEEFDIYYAVEFEDYGKINNLHKAKTLELVDQDILYTAKNSYSLTENRIYTDIEGNALGIIEFTEFGYRVAYYNVEEHGGILFEIDMDVRWKIFELTTGNYLGGKYNLYRIFDYKEDLIGVYITWYFVQDDNPLISVFYDDENDE